MIFRTRHLLLVLVAGLLGGCASDRNARYVGTVSGCGADRRAELVVSGDQVVFTPDEGTWMLRGKRTAEGDISAKAVADPNGQVRREGSFSGHVAGGQVTGDLVVPGCTAKVRLSVVPDSIRRALPPRSPLEKLL